MTIQDGFSTTSVFKDSASKKSLVNIVRNCKARVVVIPITIFIHQNTLIYDTHLKELELFDSFGGTYIDALLKDNDIKLILLQKAFHAAYKQYTDSIVKLFTEIIGEFKFYPTIDFFLKDKEFKIQKLGYAHRINTA